MKRQYKLVLLIFFSSGLLLPADEISPTAVTNTVMRGAITNFTVYLENTNATESLYWQAVNTSAWVTLSASSGTIPTNEYPVATNTVIITNSAVSLTGGTYNSQMNVYLTNAVHNSTGTVDMTLRVAEFMRSAASLTNTVRQSGTTSSTARIWNSGAGDLSYTVTTNVSWLTVSPVSGTLTGQTADATNTLTVTFTNTPVPVGTYYGALTFVSGIDGSTLDINAELTVTTGPEMAVNPQILTGSVMMGQSPASQTVRVSNHSSSESIGYGITLDSSWIAVSPTNGTLSPLTTNEHTVSYSTSALTTNSAGPSNYHATITVTATNAGVIGSPAAVAVNLTVNPRARLALNTSLVTNIVTEGHDASDCTFEIYNGSGYYTLNYAITDDGDWLLANPSSGSSTGEHDTITVEFSTIGFTEGVSNATFTVVGRSYDGAHTDSAVDATQTIAVLLAVVPAAALATDASSKYEFSARLGRAAGSTTFRVWNSSSGGEPLQYTVATNVSWLSARPVSGTSTGETHEIILTCNAVGLTPGKHTGAATITGIDQTTGTEADNSPINITVELTIYGDKGFNFGGEGNGASDLVVYKESSGSWNITNLASGFTTNVIFGGQGYTPVAGDYDGDGVTDLGVYRYASGYWYVRQLTNEALTIFGGSYWVGPELASLGGYVPVAGDYDGDGKTDPAMYCQASGLWSALFSTRGYAYVSGTFGGSGYVSVPADYDGDGKTDPAVYNETTAQWYVLYSSDNYRIISGLFGGPGFTAAPADYDGDGKTDAGVYKEATGLWIILPTSTLSPGGYVPVIATFGGPGFKPVPADYSGDGKADACVYDEAAGNWYIVEVTGSRIAWPARHGGYGFAPVKP